MAKKKQNLLKEAIEALDRLEVAEGRLAKEAILELPETLQAAAAKAIKAVVPDVRPYVDLLDKLMWISLIAVGGYLGYKVLERR